MNTIQNKQKLLLILGALATTVVIVLLVQNNIVTNLFGMTKKSGDNVTTNVKEFTEKQKEIFGQREIANPKDSSAKRELSRAYYLSGDYEKAEKLINEAIELNVSNPQFYVDLGRIYEAQGNIIGAEEVYKKAVELNTKEIQIKNQTNADGIIKNETIKNAGVFVYNIPTPYTSLAGLYLNINKPNDAVSVLLDGIKTNEKYPYFYSSLSEAYKKLGDTQKSKYYEEQFQKLIK